MDNRHGRRPKAETNPKLATTDNRHGRAQGKIPSGRTTAIAERRAEILARTSYSTLNVSLLTLFSHGTWGKLRV